MTKGRLLGAYAFVVMAAANAWAEPPAPEAASLGAPDSSAPRLTITSDSACPSEPSVLEALATLVPPDRWPEGTVNIQTAADQLVVQLISELLSDGSTQRQLSVPADCDLRAATVALVILTWTGRLASEAAGTPELRGQTKGSQAPAGALPVTKDSTPSSATAERELAAGLLLSVSGGLAPGARIDFVETRAPRGLGWQLGLTLPAQRERGTALATTSWTRAAASVAINGRVTLRHLFVSADVGLAGAYAFTSAQGYSMRHGSEAITGGFVGGTRLELPWRRLRMWTDFRVTKWLFPQTIAFDAPAGERLATVALPSFDVQCALGLAYLFR
jgi:hypothetical protein